MATEFLAYYGAPRDLVFQGCNVGDVGYYSQKIDASSAARGGVVKLLFVGMLDKRKGVKELVEALSNVKSNNWVLTIVGNGPDNDALNASVCRLKLTDKIFFAGYKQKEDLLACYADADIFVLPSHSDPFSISTSEALASGLFVIASIYDGASKDIIVVGVNGCVIDPLDGAAFAAELERCIATIDSFPSKKAISNSIIGKQNIYASAFIDAT